MTVWYNHSDKKNKIHQNFLNKKISSPPSFILVITKSILPFPSQVLLSPSLTLSSALSPSPYLSLISYPFSYIVAKWTTVNRNFLLKISTQGEGTSIFFCLCNPCSFYTLQTIYCRRCSSSFPSTTAFFATFTFLPSTPSAISTTFSNKEIFQPSKAPYQDSTTQACFSCTWL